MYYFTTFTHPSNTVNPFEGLADHAGLKKEWKDLSGWEKVCDSIIKLYDVTTLGGYVFSQKHWEMAKWDHSVIHGTIAFFQGLPIAGIVFVALEILTALAVAISISICCGSYKFSDANQASQDYFLKRQGLECMRNGDSRDAQLAEYAIELSQQEDPVSLKRAQYVANMIDSTEERERISQKLQDPETSFKNELQKELNNIQEEHSFEQIDHLIRFSQDYKNPAYKNEIHQKIIDIANTHNRRDNLLNIPHSDLTPELKTEMLTMFEKLLTSIITKSQELSLSDQSKALVAFASYFDRFYQEKVYEEILDIASNSTETSLNLHLPYWTFQGSLRERVDTIFNEKLEQKLAELRKSDQTDTGTACDLLKFADEGCDYPKGKEQVYSCVIDIAIKLKKKDANGSLTEANNIIPMLPYLFLSHSLQVQVMENWPEIVMKCWPAGGDTPRRRRGKI